MKQEQDSPQGFRSNIKEPEYRRKFIYSLVMFLAFAFLGVRNALHGPAFLDLAQITNTNVEQASAFYTAISVGSLLGTFCMGFLYDKLVNHSHLLLGSTCVLVAFTSAAIPWSSNFPLTIALFFVTSVFNAGFDIGGNTDFMRVWGKEGKMYMQFLHFSFALGTIIAPFTVEPFLSHPISLNNTSCSGIEVSTRGQNSYTTVSNSTLGGIDSFNGSDAKGFPVLNVTAVIGLPSENGSNLDFVNLSNAAGSHLYNGNRLIADTFYMSNKSHSDPSFNKSQSVVFIISTGSTIEPNMLNSEDENCVLSESRIHYAYLIAGVMCFISGLAIIGEGFANRKTKSEKPTEDHRNTQELPRWLTVIMLGLLGSLYFFHLGTSVVVIGFMMPFVVNGLGWSKDDGAKLASVYFSSFSVFRLVGVFSAKFLSPSKMLLTSNSTVIVSLIGLWISTTFNYTWGIWLSLTLTAAGIAAIFPSGILFLETKVMKMTGKVASVIWIGANIQGVVNPLLIGFLMQEVSHLWYLYLAFIEAGMCLLSYCLLEVMVKLFVSKHKRDITVEVEESKDRFISGET